MVVVVGGTVVVVGTVVEPGIVEGGVVVGEVVVAVVVALVTEAVFEIDTEASPEVTDSTWTKYVVPGLTVSAVVVP